MIRRLLLKLKLNFRGFCRVLLKFKTQVLKEKIEITGIRYFHTRVRKSYVEL